MTAPHRTEGPPTTAGKNGEQLVKVPRGKRKTAAPRSAAHPPPPQQPATEQKGITFDSIEQVNVDQSEVGEASGELPPIEEVARGVEHYHSMPEIPDDEPPHRRSAPTMGEVEVADYAPPPPDNWDGECRAIEDLMARFPIGDGQYFVRVERQQPRNWNGLRCDGVQRPIYTGLDYTGFCEQYGGGQYALMVYGPPKHVAHSAVDPATQRPRPRPMLKKPVVFTVPWDIQGYGSFEPNPAGALLYDEDAILEAEMALTPGFRPVSPGVHRSPNAADAKIHETQITHEERMQDRARSEKNHERDLIQREHNAAIQALNDSHRLAMDLMKESQTRLENELREMRQENKKGNGSPTEWMQAMSAMRPDAQNEISRLNDAHKNEMQRVADQHKRELESLRNEQERERQRIESDRKVEAERVAAERERLELRVKDAESRAERMVKEKEEWANREIRLVREESDRRISDIRAAHDTHDKSEERQRARDLETQKAMYESQIQTIKSIAGNDKTALDSEITRLRGEVERLQRLLDKKGDLPKQLAEVEALAESLGFKRDGEAEPQELDWKVIAVQVAANIAQQLPEIVQRAGEAVRGMKNQQQPQQQHVQVVQRPVPALAPPIPINPASGYGHQPPANTVFQTEDSLARGPAPTVPSVYHTPPSPMQPIAIQQAPVGAPPPPTALIPSAPQPVAMAPAPVAAVPATPPEQGQSQQPPRPVRRAPRPVPPPAPPPPVAPQVQIEDGQILMFRDLFEGAYKSKMAPQDLAQQLIEQFGPALVRPIAAGLSAERVSAAIQNAPGGAFSPLVRREGQIWLQQVQAALQAA